MLSGCITFTGQQSGINDSIIEISRVSVDGSKTKINVSGEAEVTIDDAGVVTAKSHDVGSSLLKLIRP